jgi:hypothetical protein
MPNTLLATSPVALWGSLPLPWSTENWDLWRLLLRPFPVMWVRAHRSAAQAIAAGVSERDRFGNDAADTACSALAAAHPPAPALLAARAEALASALVVQTVIASIQEAGGSGRTPRVRQSYRPQSSRAPAL